MIPINQVYPGHGERVMTAIVHGIETTVIGEWYKEGGEWKRMIMYDSKGRRLSIIQGHDELAEAYAHKLNYDPTDRLFLRYTQLRTGYYYPPDQCPHPDDDDADLLDRCMLQDCWELINQPGCREEFAMEFMIKWSRLRKYGGFKNG